MPALFPMQVSSGHLPSPAVRVGELFPSDAPTRGLRIPLSSFQPVFARLDRLDLERLDGTRQKSKRLLHQAQRFKDHGFCRSAGLGVFSSIQSHASPWVSNGPPITLSCLLTTTHFSSVLRTGLICSPSCHSAAPTSLGIVCTFPPRIELAPSTLLLTWGLRLPPFHTVDRGTRKALI